MNKQAVWHIQTVLYKDTKTYRDMINDAEENNEMPQLHQIVMQS